MRKLKNFLFLFSILGSSICHGSPIVKTINKLPKYLKKIPDPGNRFENQGKYHSAHLNLNCDNSFSYYIVFEGGYNLTLGTFSRTEDTITLSWDSLKTMQAISDSTIYNKFYKHSRPTALRIDSAKYKVNFDSLNLISIKVLNPEASSKESIEFENKKGKLLLPVKNYISINTGTNNRPGTFCDPPMKEIRILCEANSKALAVSEGKVSAIISVNGKWAIILRHGVYLSVYVGLDKVFVSKDQFVSERQELGTVATVDLETVLDLHLWKSQNQIDAKEWFTFPKKQEN